MTEYRVIVLNENDIRQIIADRYKLYPCEVNLEVSNGDPQYPAPQVYAEVRVSVAGAEV